MPAPTILSWRPFAAANMTEADTAAMIEWACAQIRRVCGLRILFDAEERFSRGDFRIRGVQKSEV